MIFQPFEPLSAKTVAENVALPLKIAGQPAVGRHARAMADGRFVKQGPVAMRVHGLQRASLQPADQNIDTWVKACRAAPAAVAQPPLVVASAGKLKSDNPCGNPKQPWMTRKRDSTVAAFGSISQRAEKTLMAPKRGRPAPNARQ